MYLYLYVLGSKILRVRILLPAKLIKGYDAKFPYLYIYDIYYKEAGACVILIWYALEIGK